MSEARWEPGKNPDSSICSVSHRYNVHVFLGKEFTYTFVANLFYWTSIVFQMYPTSFHDPCLVLMIKVVCQQREFSNSYVTAHPNETEVVVLTDSAICRRQCTTESNSDVGIMFSYIMSDNRTNSTRECWQLLPKDGATLQLYNRCGQSDEFGRIRKFIFLEERKNYRDNLATLPQGTIIIKSNAVLKTMGAANVFNGKAHRKQGSCLEKIGGRVTQLFLWSSSFDVSKKNKNK